MAYVMQIGIGILIDVLCHCLIWYEAPELMTLGAVVHCSEPGILRYAAEVDMTPAFQLVEEAWHQNHSKFEHYEVQIGTWPDPDLTHSTTQTSWRNLCLMLCLHLRQKSEHVIGLMELMEAVISVPPAAEVAAHSLDQARMGCRHELSRHHPRPDSHGRRKIRCCFDFWCYHLGSRVLPLEDVRYTGGVL